jgi:hypothetical protein
MTIPLPTVLPRRSSCQPGPLGRWRPWRAVSVSRPERREAPIWHCSGWGLPCRPCRQVRGGLLPHRFTFTPADRGSLFSVALSLGLPPPGVTRHPCHLESGLSSGFPAVIQPSARCGNYALKRAPSTGNRKLRSRAKARSVSSNGPFAPGRNRRRKAASKA